MELASQEYCLHSVLFIHRYVTFVLVIITLYSHCIMAKAVSKPVLIIGFV